MVCVGWLALAGSQRANTLDDLDSANFVRALSDYDLARHSPHFPGYPVYVALGRASAPLAGGDPILALQLPGLLGFALALGFLFAAVRRHAGPLAAILSTALAGLSPMSWLMAGRVGSDALGTAFVMIAASLLALAWRRQGATAVRGEGPLLDAAMLVCGLALGVRLSYLPIVAALVALAWFHPGRRMRGLLVGTALWLVPFVVAVGPDLLELATTFLDGHFNEWGGSVAVTGSPAARALWWTESLLVHGLAMPATGGSALRWVAFPALLSLAVIGFARLSRRHVLLAVATAAPYLIWLWLGQNPDKPRHLLPVVVALSVLGGLSLRAPLEGVVRRGATVLAPVALIAVAVVTIGLGAQQASAESPHAQLAAHLRQAYPIEGTQLFAGPSERVVHHYLPGYRTEFVDSYEAAAARMARLPHRPPVVLMTDDVADVRGRPVATFRRSPLINPHRSSLTLYEVVP